MPLVRVTRDVSRPDGSWSAGDEARMTPGQAQDAVAGGWGELVREQPPETPEGNRGTRTTIPEWRR